MLKRDLSCAMVVPPGAVVRAGRRVFLGRRGCVALRNMMARQYHIDVRPDMILIEVGPLFDDQLLVEIGTTIRRDIAFQAGIGVLLDLSQVTEFKLSPSAVQHAAVRARTENNRIAIVASSAAILGMASIYEALADPLSFGRILLVNELITAVNWLKAS